MKIDVVYPGSFAPPTYGHWQVVRAAAEIFPELTIICSTNDEKMDGRWYGEKECARMWQAYDLPGNVTVKTFQEYSISHPAKSDIIMVRGARNDKDMEYEKKVMMMNAQRFGVRKYFYILAEPDYCDISSTRARDAAKALDLGMLARCVSPRIVAILLEKALVLKNLFMVVGKPGSGKTTFFSALAKADPSCVHINTDEFSEILKPVVREKFGSDVDLVRLALDRGKELSDAVGSVWLELLGQALRKTTFRNHVFVEVPFGLEPGKDIFRFLGSKIIYVGCGNDRINRERVISRKTPEHLPFVERIPGWKESPRIAWEHNLDINFIDLGGPVEDFPVKLKILEGVLKRGEDDEIGGG